MPADTFAKLPDPAEAGCLDDLVERLRQLKVWAGDPSYETIKDRVNAAWTAQGRPASELTIKSTVALCFQRGRRRFNAELVAAVVEALHPDSGYVTQWRQALRVIGGEIDAVSQVRVQDTLPQALADFTGRTGELDQLRDAVRRATGAGGAVVISAIEGMAGVGKTQLAVHAGHLLLRQQVVQRVLFVNLRGFHADPAQPPVDPAAVLDGFLRLLGVPGHRIPHDVPGRTALYRDRLAGTRTLVVLDNAATADQVRPLLPGTPGCLALLTSRRSLADLNPATRLAVDVFDPDEAAAFLAGAVPGVPVGTDPGAAARIARRCGHLPLALSLIAGHIRATQGWTLTDHADRLDERHRTQHLDSGVEEALALSYQHLPPERRRLLRLAALHSGPDLDAFAAAALTDTDPLTAETWLEHLRRDHLLQPAAPGRYTFHDLVRAYANTRAYDEDRPSERRAALTRLFGYYVATAAAAMDTLHPAEAHRRPRVSPSGTPTPDLTDPTAAVAWLDTERQTLVAIAVHTATHGLPAYTTQLSRILSRYLVGGHHTDALTVHGHARHAAHAGGDTAGEAHALNDLGFAHLRQGRSGPAADHFQQALDLFRQAGDLVGHARALHLLAIVAERSGRYPDAADYKRHALALYQQAGDHAGQVSVLDGLGLTMQRQGRLPEAIDYYQRTLTIAQRTGNRAGEASALHGLGDIEVEMGRYEPAGDHFRQALTLYRQLGHRTGETGVLDALGGLHTRLGQYDEAVEYLRQSLTITDETGDAELRAWVLNGLGEASHAAGRTAEARTHHAAACALAADIGDRDQQARAHTGLGHAHHALGESRAARTHYEHALALYTDLGVPEADEVRRHLTDLDVTV